MRVNKTSGHAEFISASHGTFGLVRSAVYELQHISRLPMHMGCRNKFGMTSSF